MINNNASSSHYFKTIQLISTLLMKILEKNLLARHTSSHKSRLINAHFVDKYTIITRDCAKYCCSCRLCMTLTCIVIISKSSRSHKKLVYLKTEGHFARDTWF